MKLINIYAFQRQAMNEKAVSSLVQYTIQHQSFSRMQLQSPGSNCDVKDISLLYPPSEVVVEDIQSHNETVQSPMLDSPVYNRSADPSLLKDFRYLNTLPERNNM